MSSKRLRATRKVREAREEPALLIVCTGNASRSVMAGTMCEWLAQARGIPLSVTTAGTHAVEGQPMGARTSSALLTVAEMADAAVGRHRSRQLAPADVEHVDLVVAMEADHVRYVRRHHPAAAPLTGTLRRLCRDLERGAAPLATRVRALDLAHAELDPVEDVADPAGQDDAAYVSCAAELWLLCNELVRRL